MDSLEQDDQRRRGSRLRDMLRVAVPLRIIEIIQRGGITNEDLKRIGSYQEDLSGPNATDLFFKSQKPGATAERFNQLADALAVMSFFPGGITAFGDHYDGKTMKTPLPGGEPPFDETPGRTSDEK